jgi:hypothetical protein
MVEDIKKEPSEEQPSHDDYVSDYLSYVGAGAILTTLATALIYYKVPHPVKSALVVSCPDETRHLTKTLKLIRS